MLRGEEMAPVSGRVGPGIVPGQVAELIVTRTDGSRRRGSGYRTSADTVLTAAHVVDGSATVLVRFDADLPTQWSAVGHIEALDRDADVAVVVLGPEDPSTVRPPARRTAFGRVGAADGPLDVVAIGFPLFKLRSEVSTDGIARFRDTHQAFGRVAPLSNRRTATYEVTVEPPGPSPDPAVSPWEGMSGSAVWADDRIVGVVTEHHEAEGLGRLTAARLDYVTDPGVRRALGLPDDPLQLPDVATRSDLGTSYHHQVHDIAPVVLHGRDSDLERLAAVATGEQPYSWWEAPPWAGKTALTSWFVLNPPPDVDVVSFFVAAGLAGQSDSDAFLEAVAEQLTALARRPPGPPATTAVRRDRWLGLLQAAGARSSEAGRTLLLVLDGLDEDSGAAAHKPSIASLLPRRPPDGVRVLITSRPGRPLPTDVAADHPLRSCLRRPLTPSPHALVGEEFARRELADVLGSGSAAEDLLGLIAASGGGLDRNDLAELTGRPPAAVDSVLFGAGGRSVRARTQRLPGSAGADGTSRGYLFAHDTLRRIAVEQFGPRLHHYRRMLDAWCDRYRALEWPDDTPVHLLRDHPRRLAADGETGQLFALVADDRRHDRMLEVTGGDALALDEIALAHSMLLADDRPDLAVAVQLATRREELVRRNRHIPPQLPAVWAATGRIERAEALARGLPEGRRQAAALAELAVVAARADGDVAERLALELEKPEQRAATLSEVAVALARHDMDAAARVLALLEPRPRSATLLRIAVSTTVLSVERVAALLASCADDDDRTTAARSVLAAVDGDLPRAEQDLADVGDPDDRARAAAALAVAAARAGRLEVGERIAARLPVARRGGALVELLRAAGTAADTQAVDRFATLLRKAAAGARPDDAVGMCAAAAGVLRGLPGDLTGLISELDVAGEAAVDAISVQRHRDRARGRMAAARAAAGDRSGAERALAMVQAPDLQVDSLADVAVAAAELYPDHAVDTVRRIVDPRRRMDALTSVAARLAEVGHGDRAARLATEVEQLARTVPDPARTVVLAGAVAAALVAIGDRDAATALADGLPDAGHRAGVLVDVAEALAARGDVDDAAAVAELVTEPDRQVWARVAVAEGLAARGRAVAADRVVRAVRKAPIDNLLTRALAASRLAVVAAGVGDLAGATALAAEARAAIAADPERCVAAAVHLHAAGLPGEGEWPAPQEVVASIDGPRRQDRARVRVVKALIATGSTAAAAAVAEQVVSPAARVTAFAAAAQAADEPAAALHLLRQSESAAAVLDGGGEAPLSAAARIAAATERIVAAHPELGQDLAHDLPRTVVRLLATEAWGEVIPLVARLDAAAVRLVAEWMASRLENLKGISPGGTTDLR